jgi:hypothetical protein
MEGRAIASDHRTRVRVKPIAPVTRVRRGLSRVVARMSGAGAK